MASGKSKARKAESKEKSTAHQKSTKKTPPPPAVYKSEEFVQDSNSDEEQEKEVNSDEDSESDDVPSSAKPTKATSKANGKLPAPAGSSSSSEGDNEDSEESSNDEEESEDATRKAPVAMEPTKRPAKESTIRTVSFMAPPPFQPPRGFDVASLDGISKASQLLKKSNLEGKQIWYFTAPASVPITSIQAMSLSDAKKGKAVLTHQGNDYGFVRDSTEDKTYTKIMVPSSSDNGYKYASKSVDRVFHLQQVVHDPTTANISKATIPATKPIRQQPRGLKMRFRPIGFGSGETGKIGSTSPSTSDVEMEDDSSSLIYPAISKSKNADKSDGDSSDSDEEMEDAPPVSSKPHMKTKTSGTSEKEPSLKRKHSEGGEKKSKHKKAEIISEKHSSQSISVN